MITPIERKLLAYLSTILVVLIVLVFLVYRGVQTMTLSGNSVGHTLQVQGEIKELASQINQAGELAREYFLTPDERLLESYADVKGQLNSQILRLRTLTSDNSTQLQRLGEMQQLMDQRLKLLDSMIQARQREEFDVVARLLRISRLSQSKDDLSKVLGEMEFEEQRLQEVRLHQQALDARFAAAIAILGILIAAALLLMTWRSIRHEIALQLEGGQKLRQKEQELRLTLSSSNAGLWFWDLTTKRLTWSDQNCALFGFDVPECKPSYELWINSLHPEDRDRVEVELETAIRERQSFNTEHRIVRPNGEIRHLLGKGQAEYNAAGRPVKMGGINIDVTELRAAEEAFYESEERFRQIAENIEAVLWIRNAQTSQLEFISSGIERLWGINAQNLISQTESWSEYIHPDDLERARTIAQESIANNGLDQEYRIITPDGKQHWVRDRGFPVKDKTGKVRNIVGFTVDTTERKQTEEIKAALFAREQEARAQAEMANRTKDEFLAIVSHELRSPLNAMLGWSRVLRSDNVDQETHDHAIRVIEQSAQMQSRLIEDLLDSARIASGKLRIESRPVSLIPVIESAIDIIQPAAKHRSIEIGTRLDSQADVITGDAGRLQQIVWNLLSNAIKFTPRRGRVEIELKRQDLWATIIVTDTGKGIKADDLPHIFNRFHQADSATTRPSSGLGLGLSLVKDLVELHGGKITAESTGEGKGSTFTINLPLRMMGEAPVQTSESKSRINRTSAPLSFPSVLSGLRILTVDDEADARDLVTVLLSKYGAAVTAASSSAEALEFLTKQEVDHPFDLIVSDIGMPDENGYTLMRRVRQLPAPEGKIPAVALTAFGRAEDRIRALQAGFQMHVPKPVEPAELMVVIARLTGRSVKASGE